MIVKLDEFNLLEATAWLAERDETLAFVLQKYGPPPLWDRPPGFATLVHIILEQQVSLASPNAAFEKLKAAIGPVQPAPFLALSDEKLREIGFSRQKTSYCRALAQAVQSGHFDLEQLGSLPDAAVRDDMKRLKGIGDWTADVYLLMCLLRPDVLPKGDIALLEAFRKLYHLPQRPSHEVFEQTTLHWQPFRSVGARMLWHFYLEVRGEKK